MSNKEEWLDINGYHIFHDKNDTYTAYNSDGKIVYTIDSDKYLTTWAKNGEEIIFDNLTIKDIKPNMVLQRGKDKYYFSDNAITRAKVYGLPDSDGDFIEFVYNDDSRHEYEYDHEGGDVIYETILNNDGSYQLKEVSTGVTRDFDSNCNLVRIIKPNGYIDYYDNDRKRVRTVSPDGLEYYYDEYNDEYTIKHNDDDTIEYHYLDNENHTYRIKYSDGKDEYLIDSENTLTLYADGKFELNGHKGTYSIDDKRNIICIDTDGNRIFYNKYGDKRRLIDKDGTYYDEISYQQVKYKNGKFVYSMRNHIEYDEEAYNKILNSLNEINGNNIDGTISSVENSISSFPDVYSGGRIVNVKENIKGHINLIESLKEMTNYSLLAYQTCDDSLKDGLKLLIDSLFSENDKYLGDKFKSIVDPTIEDRDKDNILEYKATTNFKMLSESAIVDKVYTDKDGNRFYLNKNNVVIKIDGDNFKINYGGKDFNVSYKNGIVIAKDSKGRRLDIFGDYNIDSCQFGGNQEDLVNAYNNPYVDAMIKSYFPSITTEEELQYLNNIKNNGCGNVAITNLVFKKFEGKEEEFYKTFGYPMYELKYDSKNDGLSIDYNYEPLITDLYCHENPDIYHTDGTDKMRREDMEKYLVEKYNVSLKKFKSPLRYYGESQYNLYDIDGTLLESSGGGHAMIGVDFTDYRRIIVSSWGRKLILERAATSNYVKRYNDYEYKKYI